MKKRAALRWIVAGGLLVSGHLMAEPLSDLQTRLAGLRNDQPIRIKVEVELQHRGSAPLHMSTVRKHGMAVVVYGPRGVKVRKQRWSGSSSEVSLWRSAKGDGEAEIPLLDDVEAQDLVDPAGMMELLLTGATLLSDDLVTWQGQPARLLVIRPGQLAERKDGQASVEGDLTPLALEARIWLDESGIPLAMERSLEVRLTPALRVSEHQTLTFQQVEGRLLVAEAHETYAGTALAVLSGIDAKTMRVSVIE